MNNKITEKKNKKINIQKSVRIDNDAIIIKGIRYEIGKQYKVFSPLDSPYLFMEKDVLEKRRLSQKKLPYYKGRLKQIPSLGENGEIKGRCIYFEVNNVKYHKDFRQTESLTSILAGIVKIMPI